MLVGESKGLGGCSGYVTIHSHVLVGSGSALNVVQSPGLHSLRAAVMNPTHMEVTKGSGKQQTEIVLCAFTL